VEVVEHFLGSWLITVLMWPVTRAVASACLSWKAAAHCWPWQTNPLSVGSPVLFYIWPRSCLFINAASDCSYHLPVAALVFLYISDYVAGPLLCISLMQHFGCLWLCCVIVCEAAWKQRQKLAQKHCCISSLFIGPKTSDMIQIYSPFSDWPSDILLKHNHCAGVFVWPNH